MGSAEQPVGRIHPRSAHVDRSSAEQRPSIRFMRYDLLMKKYLIGLLVLAITLGLGVVAYRAMTVEVPVEDQS